MVRRALDVVPDKENPCQREAVLVHQMEMVPNACLSLRSVQEEFRPDAKLIGKAGQLSTRLRVGALCPSRLSEEEKYRCGAQHNRHTLPSDETAHVKSSSLT
jgi:hypothetical protein